jgi:hypothetical protein
MSGNKCCYTIFTSKNLNQKFDLRLSGEKIKYESTPKFLGITFDPKLTFKPHIENVKERCLKRVNIIKIISHKSWKLKTSTLVTTYYTLVRSVIDYMFVCGSLISKANLEVLQRIQNSAIRSIFKPSYMTNLKNLALFNKISEIKTRLEELFEQYIFKCLINNNLIISSLMSSYWRGFESRPEQDYTVLRSIRPLITTLL